MSTPDITPEELAAWADGELTGERGDAIAAAVEADPALQAKIDAHRALKSKLSAHFAPIAEEPVPDHLAALLQTPAPAAANDQIETPEGSATIVNFAEAKEKRTMPRWGWIAGPALAATLALAVFLPGGGTSDPVGPNPYADTQLASVLDSQLVADQGAGMDTRILLSFQNEGGEFCRAYSAGETGGIACRDDNGWRMEATGDGVDGGNTEFRMAGAAEIMAAAQEMAAGDALDAEAEEAAREAGWR
ncbi:anti-sigma factor family protein [Aurantiacibacter sp. D1-12]|uniref:anti-sigma factor family protein n=1 Tax=Aurantiacibacter sp. D1-12 TaxID=2993658 RepID=UPI00237CB94D|nr:hypothetical protein [Aurantiacibacter sp. D1-12]MDE1467113.1 hypothetical protein [Aurantiacibacter sp. D1-12]